MLLKRVTSLFPNVTSPHGIMTINDINERFPKFSDVDVKLYHHELNIMMISDVNTLLGASQSQYQAKSTVGLNFIHLAYITHLKSLKLPKENLVRNIQEPAAPQYCPLILDQRLCLRIKACILCHIRQKNVVRTARRPDEVHAFSVMQPIT